jgi:hypothetical protein
MTTPSELTKQRLAAIDTKLDRAWGTLTNLPADLSDQVRGLVEQFEHLADQRATLRRACENSLSDQRFRLRRDEESA